MVGGESVFILSVTWGPRSIPCTTRFSEKQWVWNGVHSASRVIEELLGRKSSGSGLETEITSVGIRYADHVAPSVCNFADKQQSLLPRGLRPQNLVS
jgi:hypothetical protein